MKLKVGEIVQIKNINDPVWEKYTNFSDWKKYCGTTSTIDDIKHHTPRSYFSLKDIGPWWVEEELKSLSEIRKEKIKKLKSKIK